MTASAPGGWSPTAPSSSSTGAPGGAHPSSSPPSTPAGAWSAPAAPAAWHISTGWCVPPDECSDTWPSAAGDGVLCTSSASPPALGGPFPGTCCSSSPRCCCFACTSPVSPSCAASRLTRLRLRTTRGVSPPGRGRGQRDRAARGVSDQVYDTAADGGEHGARRAASQAVAEARCAAGRGSLPTSRGHGALPFPPGPGGNQAPGCDTSHSHARRPAGACARRVRTSASGGPTHQDSPPRLAALTHRLSWSPPPPAQPPPWCCREGRLRVGVARSGRSPCANTSAFPAPPRPPARSPHAHGPLPAHRKPLPSPSRNVRPGRTLFWPCGATSSAYGAKRPLHAAHAASRSSSG